MCVSYVVLVPRFPYPSIPVFRYLLIDVQEVTTNS